MDFLSISGPNHFYEFTCVRIFSILWPKDDCVNLKIIYLPSTITTICGYALTNCMRLDKIVFNGTKAQWKAIELDDHWNYSAPALGIECTDGYIELQSWYESH